VAHFHHAHSASLVVHHFGSSLRQNLFGEHGGAGGIVIHAIHCFSPFFCEAEVLCGMDSGEKKPQENAEGCGSLIKIIIPRKGFSVKEKHRFSRCFRCFFLSWLFFAPNLVFFRLM
jgi:hypothetical protein